MKDCYIIVEASKVNSPIVSLTTFGSRERKEKKNFLTLLCTTQTRARRVNNREALVSRERERERERERVLTERVISLFLVHHNLQKDLSALDLFIIKTKQTKTKYFHQTINTCILTTEF